MPGPSWTYRSGDRLRITWHATEYEDSSTAEGTLHASSPGSDRPHDLWFGIGDQRVHFWDAVMGQFSALFSGADRIEILNR
jgi:hypothetical protein